MKPNNLLARKLERIAANELFDEDALKQAQLRTTVDEFAYWSMLRRYRNGTTLPTDHIMLQEFANRIRGTK